MESERNLQSLTYTFNRNETHYHSWFNEERASYIVSVIYSKYWIISLALLYSILFIWGWMDFLPLVHQIYLLCINVYFLIYLILFMLTINRKIFNKSIRHFVFWFKIFAAIQGVVCYLILRFTVIRTSHSVFLVSNIVYCAVVILAITMYSAIDGFYVSRKFKIFMGLTTSIFFTISAIDVSFEAVRIEQEAIVSISHEARFSIASLWASSVRVLCIFLWKQTILLIIKKDKCINIRHSPYIKWVIQ